MRVFVTGGSGLLGRACVCTLQAHGCDVLAPTHQELELTDFKAVEQWMQVAQPDVIVHCAAQRKPDLCESEAPEVIALNVDLPAFLARFNCPMVHLSTDYVFNGTNAPYEWDAQRRPLNAYGRQKAMAEAQLEALSHVVILRVPILYGPTPRWENSAVTVLAANLAKANGEAVLMDDSAIRYPTLTTDIAEQIYRLIGAMQGGLHGIFHYSGEEAMTKFQMSLHLAPYVHASRMQCLPDTRPPTVPRPYDCHLSTRRLKQLGLYVKPTPFAQAIRELFNDSTFSSFSNNSSY